MFGIGMPEMLLILAVALMVFGPRRLPELARTLGRAVGKVRAATRGVQREIEREMAQTGIEHPREWIKPGAPRPGTAAPTQPSEGPPRTSEPPATAPEPDDTPRP
jgi:sec-independent protein translocase protein TatB